MNKGGNLKIKEFFFKKHNNKKQYFMSLLFQINSRVYLNSLTKELKLNRPATFDDIPDSFVDRLRDSGFEFIYLLSVWTISQESTKVSLTLKSDFEVTFSSSSSSSSSSNNELKDEDIDGSGFAIHEYVVSPKLGGADSLRRFRERLKQRNLKLILDFVPNHLGLSNCWLKEHPQYFVIGNDNDLQLHPEQWTRSSATGHVLAFGKDPQFTWKDALQLNYSNRGKFFYS